MNAVDIIFEGGGVEVLDAPSEALTSILEQDFSNFFEDYFEQRTFEKLLEAVKNEDRVRAFDLASYLGLDIYFR